MRKFAAKQAGLNRHFDRRREAPEWRNLITPRVMKNFYVYILASKSRVLYVGVTSNIEKRIQQHKHGEIEGFTSRYHVNQLVYFEEAPDAESAINREKQIKRWRREKKIKLIEAMNPDWRDLSR